VERELSTVGREFAYAERYGVPHPGELERLIASARIDGHPAWEDRLDWGHLPGKARAFLFNNAPHFDYVETSPHHLHIGQAVRARTGRAAEIGVD
jgi:hypothetical protein